MRISLLHNFYGSDSPSGENEVFEAESRLLAFHGHDLSRLTKHSDLLRQRGVFGLIEGAINTPWNQKSYLAVKKHVSRFRPAVVHGHNTFPLFSPAVFIAAHRRAATVLTLHNYRLFCSAAIPMRQGRVCTECIDQKAIWPALVHGCYRASRLATLPLAISIALHRSLRTWEKCVDAFITLTEFQRDIMIKAGLPSDKVFVKPNFYQKSPVVIPWFQREPYVVFVGRLSEEKGLRTLVNAWRLYGVNAPELRILGDGPLRHELESISRGLPIRFYGHLAAEDAHNIAARARLLIFPSQWFEGFSLVLAEAFAFGTPTVVSNLGPLPTIVKDNCTGFIFEAGNAESLLRVTRSVWSDDVRLQAISHSSREEFEQKYTAVANYKQLIAIYEQAIKNAALRGVF